MTHVSEHIDHCDIHDEDHDVSELMTGRYSYCASCSREKIERNMQVVRTELGDRGHPQYAACRTEEVA